MGSGSACVGVQRVLERLRRPCKCVRNEFETRAKSRVCVIVLCARRSGYRDAN